MKISLRWNPRTFC